MVLILTIIEWTFWLAGTGAFIWAFWLAGAALVYGQHPRLTDFRQHQPRLGR